MFSLKKEKVVILFLDDDGDGDYGYGNIIQVQALFWKRPNDETLLCNLRLTQDCLWSGP